LNPDDKVLNKYTLYNELPTGGAAYERWEAFDEFGGPVLLKAWPFGQEKASQAERALWNIELRNLFRLSSLPSVDEHLVILRDAGLDDHLKYFILILHAPGFIALDGLLQGHDRPNWLSRLSQPGVRADLWHGIRRMVLGLKQIHQLHMVHRAISPYTVLLDPGIGPKSFRLDGGDLLMRLGDVISTAIPTEPDNSESDSTYSFDSDWFQLGWLMVQLLLAGADGNKDIEDILSQVNDSESLIREEKYLVNGLIGKNKRARLTMADEVLFLIDQIVTSLGRQGQHASKDDYLGLVFAPGPMRKITLAIIEADPEIFPNDIQTQRQFIQEDLRHPQVVQVKEDEKVFNIVGNRLCYRIREHMAGRSGGIGNWDMAFCEGPTELRYAEEDQIELSIPIKVYTSMEAHKCSDDIKRGAVTWRPYIFSDTRRTGRADQKQLQRIHDFFRVTNQLELLMRDAELYSYEVEKKKEDGGATVLVIKEVKKASHDPFFAKRRKGMLEFLANEREKSFGDLVHLDDNPSLSMGRMVPKNEFWTMEDDGIDEEKKTLTLRRVNEEKLTPAPDKGIIRTFGMFGQMSLIRRRRKAIDRLENHAYLLRALNSPAFTRLDAGSDAPLPIPVDPKKIDEAKQSAMQSIWKTRPLFALQGPPGTGKTTLVANLLAQLYKDDPVVQVLVTAQAHAAVDVLREKVEAEFKGKKDRPLVVRLPKKKGGQDFDPYYVESVAEDVLKKAVSDLGQLKNRIPLQNRWIEVARKAMAALRRKGGDMLSNDFKELIKRSAGITYCTTTAGNLAELADSTQTFDWSIVEEAGKAHGFDLVLPLQTGHRWLMIGDQKQLDPYRYDDFKLALDNLEAAFEALQTLPRSAGGQLDRELISRWGKYDELEKIDCERNWKDWLGFFRKLHKTCSRMGDPNDPGDKAMAKMLNQQHRMHPTIGDLVSKAYYRGRIRHMTVDDEGQPLPRVVHPFVAPEQIRGKAIVWIDVPRVRQSEGHIQKNEHSDVEVQAIANLLKGLDCQSDQKMSLAILSPYRKQIQKLNSKLEEVMLPDWLKPDKLLKGRIPSIKAKTVDSFQGDQADVVVVSLVRNNWMDAEKGLGFLRKSERMNVLFSRAERLLVLVGSWEFFKYQLKSCSDDPDLPLGSWKIAIDYLQHCFDKKLAAKIDAEKILPKEQL